MVLEQTLTQSSLLLDNSVNPPVQWQRLKSAGGVEQQGNYFAFCLPIIIVFHNYMKLGIHNRGNKIYMYVVTRANG